MSIQPVHVSEPQQHPHAGSIEPTVSSGAAMILGTQHGGKDGSEIEMGLREGGETERKRERERERVGHPHGAYVFKWQRRERRLPGARLARAMLAVLFLVMFLAGWNDASQGPLLPSLQSYYDVNYLVISTIWIANFVGFLTSGIANVPISDRLGFGIAAPLGASMQGLAYVLICWGCPYPLFVIAYVFNGFGLGLQDAQVNSLLTRLPNPSTKMFLMHAMYGFGATVSPFVATAFVQQLPTRVYLYFTVSLALALLTAGSLVLVFKGRTEDQVAGKRVEVKGGASTQSSADGATTATAATAEADVQSRAGDTPTDTPLEVRREKALALTPSRAEAQRSSASTSTSTGADEEEVAGSGSGSGHKMKRIMQTPVVHLMAIYMLVYVGVEVTIGGWTTSFLEGARGGNSNVGYVSSGYFGGLTLGRIVLIPVTARLGNHLSIFIYSALVLVLSIIIWVTHSIIANSICFSIIGICLGPIYPIVMVVVTEIIPGELQGGTIGWLASLGQAGSAIMPFIVGAISDRYGVWILQPFILAFMAFSIIIWFLVVRSARKHSALSFSASLSTSVSEGASASADQVKGDR